MNDRTVAPFRFAVAVLGAGASVRMGRPKLVLPWGSTTILGHLLEQWRRLGAAQIAVVCAPGETAVAEELDRLAFTTAHRIINPTPVAGMFSSVQCAARWDGWDTGITHLLLTLGDQPLVREDTLRMLLLAAGELPNNIWQPAANLRPRHPVVLPREVWAGLSTSTEPNLKAFLEKQGRLRKLVYVEDEGLDLDIDRPEDYERASQMRRSGQLPGLSPTVGS